MILGDKVEWQRKRGKEGEEGRGRGGMRREGSLDQIRIEVYQIGGERGASIEIR